MSAPRKRGEEQMPEQDRSRCTPCRGTGKVKSSLGGESNEVTCPWCGGSGAFQAGGDAQERDSAQLPSDSTHDTSGC